MIPVGPSQHRIFYSSIKFQKSCAYRASLPCTHIQKLNTLSRGSKQICNGCHLSLPSALMNNTVNMDQIAHQLQSQPSPVHEPHNFPNQLLTINWQMQFPASTLFSLLSTFLLQALPAAPALLSHLPPSRVPDLISAHSFWAQLFQAADI